MADSVVKLRIDSKEYDANIKRAGQALTDYFNKVREGGGTLKYLNDGVLEAVQAMGQLGTMSGNTKGALRELTVATTDMTAAYRALTDEEKASPIGAAMAQSIAEMTERAGEMKDAMADVSAAITNAASDTRLFDQLSQGASVLTAGFQGLTGAGKLLGINMGDNVEVIAKLQAAMAVTNSLTTIQNALQKQSALMQGVAAVQARAHAAALELQAKGTVAATAAQRAFNLVAKANPYVLLATAIIGVVSALAALGSKSKETEGPLADLATQADETDEAIKRIGENVDFDVSIGEAVGRAKGYLRELRVEAARAKLEAATRLADQFNQVVDAPSGFIPTIWQGVRVAADKLGLWGYSAEDAESDAHKEQRERIQKMVDDAQAELEAAEGDVEKSAISLSNAVATALGDTTSKSVNEIRAAISRLNEEIDELPQDSGMRQYYVELRDTLNAALPQKPNTRPTGPTGNKNKPDEVFPVGSMKQLQQEMQGLQKAQSLVTSYAGWHEYQKQIDAVNDSINILKGNLPNGKEAVFTISLPNNEVIDKLKEIAGIKFDEHLSDGQPLVVTADTQEAMQKMLELTSKIEGTTVELKVKPTVVQMETGTSIQNAAGMKEYIGSLQQMLEHADFSTPLYNSLSEQLADMTTLQNLVGESLKVGLGTAMFDVADELGADFWTRAMEGGVENADWQAVVDKINEKRKELGLDALTLDFQTGSVSAEKESSKDTMGQFQKLTSGLSSVSSGLQQMGVKLPDSVTKVLGGIQGLMSVIQGVQSIVSVFSTSTATAQVASTTANTTMLAAINAQLPLLIASINANTVTPSIFANGGVVGKAAAGMLIPGTSYSGDNLRMPIIGGRGMIGVNSGELILNESSQNNLAASIRAAESLVGMIGAESSYLSRFEQGLLADSIPQGTGGGASVQPYVSGEIVYLGVNNHLKRSGQGEIVTTSMLRRMGLM